MRFEVRRNPASGLLYAFRIRNDGLIRGISGPLDSSRAGGCLADLRYGTDEDVLGWSVGTDMNTWHLVVWENQRHCRHQACYTLPSGHRIPGDGAEAGFIDQVKSANAEVVV